MNISFGQPEFASGAEIRRDGAERHLTIREVLKRHNLAELVKDAFAAQQSTALPGEIHQAKHVPVAEGTYPGFEFREFAARIRGADKRSYGTSRNDIDVNAHLV